MKLILTTTLLLVFLTACKTDKQPTSIKTETSETIEINPEIDAESNTAESYLLTLQGKWKRTTYPFGTIEVKAKTIKFTAGEGATEPAKFENFSFSKTCPFNDNTTKDLQRNYMVLEDKRICSPFLIKADTLFMIYSKNKAGIPYVRMTK